MVSRQKELGPDYTEAEKDIFPLVVAISNNDMAMFKYFWSQHFLWDQTHLYAVLENIFTKSEWNEVL